MTEEIMAKAAYSPLHLFRRLRGQTVCVFPNTGNAGDGYIMHATHRLLSRYGVRGRFLGRNEVVSGEIVLFGGGGNLIEGRYATMANTIRRNVEHNLCFLLPHSIVGYADLMSLVGARFQVFVREPRSLQDAIASGADPDFIRLAEDMAFYVDAMDVRRDQPSTAGKIACFRSDEESLGGALPDENHDLSLNWNGDWWWNASLCEASTAALAAALAPYDLIATDRLHICILAAQLGRRVLFGANAYYKNEEVYHHSLRPRFPNVEFYDDRLSLLDDFRRA